jgi:hypothetical protein
MPAAPYSNGDVVFAAAELVLIYRFCLIRRAPEEQHCDTLLARFTALKGLLRILDIIVGG